jgi:hypothetical protein
MTSPFTPQMIAWAQAMEAKWQIPAALALAAAYVESGLGEHTPPGSNNWFGIKAVGGGGSVTATKEQNPDGSWVTIQAGFAVYDSPAAGFDAYGKLLGLGSPYRAAVTTYINSAHQPIDVRALARSIAVKYATAQTYGATLVSTMELYNLYQYDNPPAAPAAPQGAPPMATTPATPAPTITAPLPAPTHVETAIKVGDALQILLQLADSAAETAATGATAFLPAGVRGIVSMFFGPTVIQGYIHQAFAQLEALTANQSVQVDTSNALVAMVVKAVNDNEPSLVAELTSLEAIVQPLVTKFLGGIAPTTS